MSNQFDQHNAQIKRNQEVAKARLEAMQAMTPAETLEYYRTKFTNGSNYTRCELVVAFRAASGVQYPAPSPIKNKPFTVGNAVLYGTLQTGEEVELRRAEERGGSGGVYVGISFAKDAERLNALAPVKAVYESSLKSWTLAI